MTKIKTNNKIKLLARRFIASFNLNLAPIYLKMSHTLKKLEQSEIDRGLRKGTPEKKPKSSQGLFIVFFVVILSSILVVINLRKGALPEQASLQKKVVASVLRDTTGKEIKPKVIKQGPIKVTEQVVATPVLAKKKEKSQNIEVIKPLETVQGDLTEQQQIDFFMKNSHIIESEVITNVGLVAEKKVSKKELKKKVLYDNEPPAFINQEQPTLWKDLSERFKMSMPEMTLNVVSFTEKKKDQYIIMNMKKYQLDEIINKGPSVEEIQKDAVILQYEGKRFIMSLWRKHQRSDLPH